MKLILSATILIIITTSCNTSYITSSWKAENATAGKYKKILVLGLMGDPDPGLREKMEEHMAGDLNDLGYNAVSATRVYGVTAFENKSGEAEILKELQNKNIDAVITIVLLNKTKERDYIPARLRYSPNSVFSDNLWSYYTTMHDRLYSPGYYETTTKYFWESNFYILNNETRIYTAQSQSFDPESSGRLAHEYGLMIVKNMVYKNVLQQQKTEPARAF